MEKNKKVYMILTNGFDPDVRVYKEAKYLVNQKFDVTILCWDRKCEYKNRQEQNLDGIKIKRFLIPSKPGTGLKQIFPYFKFILNIKKYLGKREYDYLHCHDFDGIIVGMFAKNKKNKKVIFDMHEIYNHYAYAKNIFFDIIFRHILNKCDSIIYVTDKQIKNLNDSIKSKLLYLPNYPEKKYYEPINKNQSQKIRINYIGSLRDYNSLKALVDVKIKNLKYEIGLYGTGICYEKIKNNLANKSVKIAGKYDGVNEIGEIYRNTDILYCSYDPNVANWKNAYPVKLYEAILTETPIIVSEKTLASEFVNKNSIGVSIKYGDKEDIARAIKQIVDNYEFYRQSIKKISVKYDWKKIEKGLKKIYM